MPDDRASVPAPASLDASALERVIARAAELATRAGEVPERLTEDQLVELGKEVGIPAEYLRQALAEERTRVVVPEDQSVASGRFGPRGLSASRTIAGTPDRVLAALDRWMQREECLRVKRHQGERMTWEARRDLVGNIKRGFNVGGRGYALSKAADVGATVVKVDQSRVLVRLDADVAPSRRESVTWSTVCGIAGLGVAGAMMALAAYAGGSMPIAGAVAAGAGLIGGAASAGVARSQRRLAARIQLALEQVLDHVERGDAEGESVLSTLTAVARSIR